MYDSNEVDASRKDQFEKIECLLISLDTKRYSDLKSDIDNEGKEKN